MLAHHVLLAAAAAALGAAGWRVAGALATAGGEAYPRGLERGVTAAVLAAAAAAISALGWGLAGLGGSAWVLAGTSAALLAAALRFVAPAPAPRGRPWHLGAWAAAGAGVIWVAWLGRHPVLAIDPLTYHLPEALLWVQDGHPGRGEEVVYEFPIQNYPLTGELLLAWGLAIGRSLGVSLLLVPLSAALLVVAGWAALRRLGVPRAAAIAALAAVVLLPLTARQMHGPHTDLPGLAWLAACWCLTLAARERAVLLAPALVAAGLAIGTKTTVAPLALAIFAAGGWRARHALRAHAGALALGAAAAVAAGGVWYVGNLIEHGSPLWPFVATPWGDALPPYLEAIDTAFIERPLDTLRGRESIYADALAGGLLLLVAALAAAAITRTRAVVLGAIAVAAGALLWANAPFTGLTDDPVRDLSISTPRYLLPTLAAAAATLALAARRHAWATWVLAAAALWSLERTLALPYPGAPSAPLLAAGLAAGALAAVVARRAPRALVAVAAAAGAAAGLTVAADGLVQRHAGIGQLPSSAVIAWLDARAGDEPVVFAPGMLGALAGNGLERPLSFIGRDEPCERVLARRGWVVVGVFPFPDRREAFTADDCLAGERPAYRDDLWRVYDRRQSASTSRQSSRPVARTEKSPGVIASARGS